MSIDMTTVTQIMHGAKEVIKIEDTNGGILWQKAVPVQRDILYYIQNNNSTVHVLDLENKSATSITSTGSSPVTGSSIFGYNNKLYAKGTTASSIKELTITTSPNTMITFSTPTDTFPGSVNGNNCYTLGDGKLYFNSSGSGTTYVKNADGTDTTKTFTYTPSGNNVFKYNGKYYGTKSGTTTPGAGNFFEYDETNQDWKQATTIPEPSISYVAWDMWVWKGRLFYDHGTSTTHYEYDSTNNTWVEHTWTSPIQITGARVFTDGVDCYCVGNASSPQTSTDIYKLDITTDTWTLYWTLLTAVRGDYFINERGSAQVGQNARPRLS